MKENVDRAQKRLGCVRKEIQRKENGSGQNNGDTVGLKKKCKGKTVDSEEEKDCGLDEPTCL